MMQVYSENIAHVVLLKIIWKVYYTRYSGQIFANWETSDEVFEKVHQLFPVCLSSVRRTCYTSGIVYQKCHVYSAY